MSTGDRFVRFSLPTLFGAVMFIAFGVAAIRYASPLWAGLTMTATMPVLFAAILGALFRIGSARAFWTGVAVCGWGYLLLVLVPWFEAGVGQHLPTTYLLGYVHGQLQKPVPMTPGGGMGPGGPGAPGMGPAGSMGPGMGGGPMGYSSMGGMPGGGGIVMTVGPDASLVLRTGHALFALLFGFVGGVVAKWFYLTRSPGKDELAKA